MASPLFKDCFELFGDLLFGFLLLLFFIVLKRKNILGDFSLFSGIQEMNIWFDEDEFMSIYQKINQIYDEIRKKN